MKDLSCVTVFLDQEQAAEVMRYKVLLDGIHEVVADISNDTHATDQKVSVGRHSLIEMRSQKHGFLM